MTDPKSDPSKDKVIYARPLESEPKPQPPKTPDGQFDGYLNKEVSDSIRSRQKSRSLVVGLLLGAAAILFYLITVAKISEQ